MFLSKRLRWTIYCTIIAGVIIGGWYLTATERPDRYTPRDEVVHDEELVPQQHAETTDEQVDVDDQMDVDDEPRDSADAGSEDAGVDDAGGEDAESEPETDPQTDADDE